MRLIPILLLLLIGLPSPAQNAPPKALTGGPRLESLSLTQLAELTNYLMARNELDGGAGKILACDAQLRDVFSGLNHVHSLLDTRAQSAQLQYVKEGPASYSKRIAHCSEDCDCLAYSMMIEPPNALHFSKTAFASAHEENLKSLKTQSVKITAAAARKCAEKQKWICQRPWLPEL